MNRQISLLSVGCLAFAAALPAPDLLAQQAEEAPPPAVVPDLDVAVADAAVPKGRPTEISDWALAGVLWSDAHLVRKLATASARQSENSRRREKMALLAQDCDSLIESLESFGWKKVVAVQADRAIAEEAAAVDEPVTVEDRADLDADLDPLDPPFHLRRYRVDDYVDEVEAERLDVADAVEDGVEAALAAGTENASSGFDVDRTSAADPREVQTRSATLPYSARSIYEVDSLHPNATYPRFVQVPERELAQETTRVRPTVPSARIVIDRYTDQAERFSQDADWVKFQLTANQQRWLMLRANNLSDEELAQQVNAAILQLKADAATAVASSDDPQLVAILRRLAE